MPVDGAVTSIDVPMVIVNGCIALHARRYVRGGDAKEF
jgi:hypothetical protein